jgi:hypothetical protein
MSRCEGATIYLFREGVIIFWNTTFVATTINSREKCKMKYDSAVLNIRMQQFNFYKIQMYVRYCVISVCPLIMHCSSFYIKRKQPKRLTTTDSFDGMCIYQQTEYDDTHLKRSQSNYATCISVIYLVLFLYYRI